MLEKSVAYARKLLRLAGVDVYRVPNGSAYMQNTPHGYKTYCPWNEPWLLQRYEAVRRRTVVTEDRCYVLHKFAERSARLAGEFAECGVYQGGTAHFVGQTLQQAGSSRPFHLFDTFAGMPEEANADPSLHRQGDFGDTSLGAVKEFLRAFPFVEFHPGPIPDLFANVADRKFAFVHVDVDLYLPAKRCCEFFYPRMVPGGVMVFDDYGFPSYVDAEKKAVDEFFADKPEEPFVLRSGQAFVIKL
jgi:hypothetical protein